MFTPEYYQQLRELGVLVDGADLSRDSLNDFEEIESRVASRTEGNLDHDEDQRDLIGEYLEHEYRKEQLEDEEAEREAAAARRAEVDRANNKKKRDRADSGINEVEDRGGGGGRRATDDRYSRPSSGRTLSSRSFPDDDEDEYKESQSQHLGSQDDQQSNRHMRDDDDEIFYIHNNQAPMRAGRRNQLQQQQQQRQQYQGRTTPSQTRAGSRGASSPSMNFDRRLSIEDNQSAYSDVVTTNRSRPSSVTSHFSTASENVSARQRRAEAISTQRMSKAKSQESFFEGEDLQTPKSEKSHHKRILPQPGSSSSEANQSFRLKSKSATNIAAARAGPVKPTHMSLSEITRLSNLDDSSASPRGAGGAGADGSQMEDSTAGNAAGDESVGDLTSRFTQEAQKRKQATELVQQLQKDYNSLLTKYALAELTIDEMRLGAKITIHTDSPTPGQVQTGVVSPAMGQNPQVMQLRSSPAQATLRSSPGQGILGHMSPLVGVGAGGEY